jgi:hypothetical protein
MDKSPYDIIQTLVDRLILPKYPIIKSYQVDSFMYGWKGRKYEVRFITKKKMVTKDQEEIDSELKTLFKMASLDHIDDKHKSNNKIQAWFKTTREKEYSFTSNPNYSH